MANFSTFKPSIGVGQRDYVTKIAGALDELDARFNTAAVFAGTVQTGFLTASVNENGLAGDFVNADTTNGFGLRVRSNGSAANRYVFLLQNAAGDTDYFRVSTATGSVGDVTMGGALTTNGGLQTFGANDSGGSGFRMVRVPNV